MDARPGKFLGFVPVKYAPIAMLLLAAALYGTYPSLNKFAAEDGVPPFAYTFWFSILGALLCLIVCGLQGIRPGFSSMHIKAYAATGILGATIPTVMLAYAAPKLPASVVSLVLSLTPGTTYALALAVRMDRLRAISIAGLVLGLCGVCFIVLPQGALPDGTQIVWLLLAATAPVCFAFSNIAAVRYRPPASPSIGLSFGMLLLGGLAILPFVVATESYYIPSLTGGAGSWAIFAVAAIMAAFIYLFFEIVRLAGPVFFAQFNYLSLIAGIAWASVLFRERPSWWFAAASILMLLGVLMVNAGTRAAVRE